MVRHRFYVGSILSNERLIVCENSSRNGQFRRYNLTINRANISRLNRRYSDDPGRRKRIRYGPTYGLQSGRNTMDRIIT